MAAHGEVPRFSVVLALVALGGCANAPSSPPRAPDATARAVVRKPPASQTVAVGDHCSDPLPALRIDAEGLGLSDADLAAILAAVAPSHMKPTVIRKAVPRELAWSEEDELTATQVVAVEMQGTYDHCMGFGKGGTWIVGLVDGAWRRLPGETVSLIH